MTLWTRRHFLATSTVMIVQRSLVAAQSARTITIAAEPLEPLGDYGLGVRLGASEAERAAMLLGHRFAIVHSGPAMARVAGVAPARTDIPVVAMRGVSGGPCVFVTETPVDAEAVPDGAVMADWHPEFRRYGAGELNERFERAYGKPMTAPAWHGWIAVKAIVEAALRGEDLCAELARLRFDGHKGRALTFDPVSRRLRHPALVITKAGDKTIIEVVP